MEKQKTTFAPMLTIDNGIRDVDFYKNAFGAVELRRFSNDDGTIHVSEMEINGAMFHLHEQNQNYKASPFTLKGTTAIIGLFVDDVHTVMEQAVKAGATVVSPVQDYDYGYRQGEIADVHGHRWQIQQVI
ncbi:MAG TPA: VOC family protein [Mucilaginibacter sp.]|jgi:PhnB protein